MWGGGRMNPPLALSATTLWGCTNQSQISWLFPIWSLLSSGKVIFFVTSAKKNCFCPKKVWFGENGQKHCFLTFIGIFCFNFVISMLWKIFEVHYMSVGQKLTMLKIRSTSVTFLSLSNLKAAPEENMQLRRLSKGSNESLGPYLFGKFEFCNF